MARKRRRKNKNSQDTNKKQKGEEDPGHQTTNVSSTLENDDDKTLKKETPAEHADDQKDSSAPPENNKNSDGDDVNNRGDKKAKTLVSTSNKEQSSTNNLMTTPREPETSNQKTVATMLKSALPKDKKRRPSSTDPPNWIGVTEFAALLEDDRLRHNYQKIQRCETLRRFSRQVRSERKRALQATRTTPEAGESDDQDKTGKNNHQDEESGLSENDDDDADSEEEESDDEDDDDAMDVGDNETTSGRKRSLYASDEAWKEDTANYNVPFVGTSIRQRRPPVQRTVGGAETASSAVRRQEWPTGLVRMYLQQSPRALELVRARYAEKLVIYLEDLHSQLKSKNSKSKETPKWRVRKQVYQFAKSALRVIRCHLRALTELVTAALPVHHFRSQHLSDVVPPEQQPQGAVLEQDEQQPPWIISIMDETIPALLQPLVSILDIMAETKPREYQRDKRKEAENSRENNAPDGNNQPQSKSKIESSSFCPVEASIVALLKLFQVLAQTSLPAARSINHLLNGGNVRPIQQTEQERESEPQTGESISNSEQSHALVMQLLWRIGRLGRKPRIYPQSSERAGSLSKDEGRHKPNTLAAVLSLLNTILSYRNPSLLQTLTSTFTRHSFATERDQRDTNRHSNHYPHLFSWAVKDGFAGLLQMCVEQKFQHNMTGEGKSSDSKTERTSQLHSRGHLRLVMGLLTNLRWIWCQVALSSGLFRDARRRVLEQILAKPCLRNIVSLAMQTQLLTDDDKVARTQLSLAVRASHQAQKALYQLVTNEHESVLLIELRAGTTKSAVPDTSHETNLALLSERSLVSVISQLRGSFSWWPFLDKAMAGSPTLIPAVLRTLEVPDPVKTPVEYITALHWFTRISGGSNVRCVSLMSCLPTSESSLDSATVLGALMPTNWKRVAIVAALRSENALVVTETLKAIYWTWSRLLAFVEESGDSSETISKLLRLVQSTRLPDFSLLLSLLTKFINPPDGKKAQSHVVLSRVLAILCLVMKCTRVPLASAIKKYDWSNCFVSMQSWPKYLRLKFMSTLKTLWESMPDLTSASTQCLTTLLREVVLVTRDPVVHSMSHHLATLLLKKHGGGSNMATSDVGVIRQFEATCWIDGMTKGCLPNLQELLQATTRSDAIQSLLECAQALEHEETPSARVAFDTTPASPLLRESWKLLYHKESSSEWQRLVCEITGRLLLFHVDPRPVAALVLSSNSSSPDSLESCSPAYFEESVMFRDFFDYIRSIQEKTSDEKKFKAFVDACFASSSWFNTLLKMEPGHQTEQPQNKISLEDRVAGIRFLCHALAVSATVERRQILFSEFRRLLVPIMTSRGHEMSHFLKTAIPLLSSIMPDQVRVLNYEIQAIGASIFPSNILETIVISEKYSGVATPQSLLATFMEVPFVPVWAVGRIVSSILESSKTAADLNPLMNMFLIRMIRSLSDTATWKIGQTDNRIIEPLFAIWGNLEIGKNAELLTAAHWAIGAILSKKDSYASVLVELFDDLPAEDVLSKGLQIEAEFEPPENYSDSMLLTFNLLQSDQMRYSQALYYLLSTSTTGDHVRRGLTRFLSGHENSRVWPLHVHRTSLQLDIKVKAASIIMDESILLSSSVFSLHQAAFTYLLAEFGTYVSMCTPERLEELGRKAAKSSFESSDASLESKAFYLRYVLHVLESMAERNANHKEIKEVVSNLLRLLSQTIRQVLKEARRIPPDDAQTNVRSVLQSFRSVTNFLATKTRSMRLEEEGVATTILACIRSCLKYGMGIPDSTLGLECLVSVRYAVKMLSDLDDFQQLGESSLTAVVFELSTTHSNFERVLKSGELVKMTMISILDVCVSVGHKIVFNHDLLQIILSNFDAGMAKPDTVCRRFLSRYGSLSQTALDDLQWGPRAKADESERVWVWLPTLLEEYRVHKTLADFPDKDVLNAEQCDGWDLEVEKLEYGPIPEDRRYSPGFLLPLILASMEEAHTGNVKLALPHFIQLCKKGAMALAIASTCCEDDDVRRVALAIVYLACKMASSDEAREYKGWEERPQLELVINAIRRALVREKVLASSHVEIRGGVPLISPVASIFLARASLILDRPGHQMFPSINRYFLRIQHDHGAFHDFRRLPGFISLFCSTDEGDGFASAQRIWSIRMLKESFVSARCFGAILATHAFELLLSRIEDITISPQPEDQSECELLLSTLRTIVSRCDEGCMRYLLKKVGLLAWIQSLILVRGILEKVPSTFHEVLGLVCKILEVASGILRPAEVSLQLRGLAPRAISACLRQLDNGCFPRHMSALPSETALRCLSVLLDQLRKLSAAASLLDNTILTTSAIHILNAVSKDNQLHQTFLLSVSALDVNFGSCSMASDQFRYCEALLQNLLQVDDPTADICKSVCIRIYDSYLKLSDSQCDGRSALLGLTRRIRPICSRWEESHQAWQNLHKSLLT